MRAIWIALLAIGMFALAGYGDAERVVTVAYSSDVQSLDPHTETYNDAVAVKMHIYDYLVRLDFDGSLTPVIAKTWEVSSDGLRYTFALRDDLRFHDGTPVDAQAVKVSFDRVIAPTFPTTSVKGFFNVLASVEVLDKYSVQFTLKNRYAPFLNLMGAYGFVCKPQAGEDPTSASAFRGTLEATPIGSGPFRPTEWVQGERLVLERWAEYWGEQPQIDKIIYLTVPEASSRLAMLEAGEVDVILRVSPDDAILVDQAANLHLLKAKTARTMYFTLNMKHAALSNVLIRQAINYAVNVPRIINTILRGAGAVVDCPMGPASTGYHSLQGYYYDPTKAVQLLSAAGYPDGFALTMAAPRGRYVMDDLIAQAVQADLAKVGIKADLELFGDVATYFDVALSDARADMIFLGWAGSTREADGQLYQTLHSSSAFGPWNVGGYSNPEFDRLLDTAREEVSYDARMNLYEQAETLVMNDAPWLFLYYQQVFTGVSGRLMGVEMSPAEHLILTGAYLVGS